jgi:hypothetical protein
MKISVQLEASSPEELQAFFAMFHVERQSVSSGEIAQYPKLDTEPESEKLPLEEVQQPTPAERVAMAQALTAERMAEVTPTQPQESVPQQAAEPAQEKPKRTRKAKPPTVDETLQEALEEGKKQAAPVEPEKPAPVKTNGKDVSRQDLLDTFSEYVAQYGVSFGYTDISKLLQTHLGEDVRKASDVPEASLAAAIDVVTKAIKENPFNRKRDYA